MDDDQLRRVLRNDDSSGDAVEQALLRTRTVGESRLRRRRLTLRVALPLAAAAGTAAVVVLAVAHPGAHGRNHSPAASPAPPTPTPTPTTGTWYRHVGGVSSSATGSVDLAGVWVVRLTTPNTGTFDVRPADRFGDGTLQYDGSRGGWVVDVLHRLCGNTTGVYRVSFSGPSLIFNVVHDGCEPRRDVMDNMVLAPLTNPSQLTG
jgi:hypothetical protein